MSEVNINSHHEISQILKMYYSDIPEELKKSVSAATPIEIGFSLSKHTQIFVMFGEGFKGFLTVVRKENRELRLAFVRTFFGTKTNIPSIDFVNVLFENNMPVKRDFLNVILDNLDSDAFFDRLIRIVNRKDLDKFLQTIVNVGKKTDAQKLVPLDTFDYEFATNVLKEITDAVSMSLKEKKKLKNALIDYVSSSALSEKFPRMARLFAAYISSL